MKIATKTHEPFVRTMRPFIGGIPVENLPIIGLKVPMVISRGFTLVELMLALVVIAILAGLAIPFYQQFVESSRLTSAANNILADLTLARSEAIKRQQGQVVVCTSASGAACGDSTVSWTAGRIVFWDRNSSGNFDSSGNPAVDDIMLKVQGSLPESIDTTTTPANTVMVAYTQMGAPAGAPAATFDLQITSTKLGTSRRICINNVGRVSIQQNAASCT